MRCLSSTDNFSIVTALLLTSSLQCCKQKIFSKNTAIFVLLESTFHSLFCRKFSFKLVTISKSYGPYGRKQKWVFFSEHVAVAPDCTLPASASSESSRSLGGDGRRAWSPFLRFLIGDHGVWGPCRGILCFMPLSESKSTRTVVSNAVGVCAMSMMRQLV